MTGPSFQPTTGLVAEVPSKFARAGGSRPDFGPEKSKKTHKNPHKIKIKSKINCDTVANVGALHLSQTTALRPLDAVVVPDVHPKQIKPNLKTKSSR
jgi:hypothetical protein